MGIGIDAINRKDKEKDSDGFVYTQEPTPFDEADHPFNNPQAADDMASNFGMTAEEMAAAGMYPDGTPFDSGPAATDPREDTEEEDFMRAVDALSGDGLWQGR